MKHPLPFVLLNIVLLLMLSCDNKKHESVDIELPEDKIAIKSVGLAYLEENQLANAKAAFEKLIEVDANDPLGYANLGLVHLRMGEYEMAIEKVNAALKLDQDNPDIRLILASVYEHHNQHVDAVNELNAIIGQNSKYAKAYYRLARLHTRDAQDTSSLLKQEEYLSKVVELEPANIVPRFQLIEIQAQLDRPDQCLQHLDKLREIIPVLPRDAEDYFTQARQFLHKGNTTGAVPHIRRLHGHMKLTSQYIAGKKEIKGPGGEHIGFPVFTTSQSMAQYTSDGQSLLDIMQFTEVADVTGLQPEQQGMNAGQTTLALADYDSDGDIDVYYSYLEPGTKTSRYFLYNNDLGSFTDVANDAGIRHEGIEEFSTFTDYNNDGFIDLFIITKGASILYQNNGDATYTNVTEKAGLDRSTSGNSALFCDLDHDGDLDLYIARDGSNAFYRNNADGTFTEQAASMGLAGDDDTYDVQFGDFDEDGDLDLFNVNQKGDNALFTNLRRSRFKDIAATSGVSTHELSTAAAISDYNNDGMPDIFIAGNEGHFQLFLNDGSGTFSEDKSSDQELSLLKGASIHDAVFFDFDNDGYEDLLVAGTTENETQQGVFLFHNDSLGQFTNVTHLLPEQVRQGHSAEIGDFNEDGDLDIFLTGPDGIQLIRNETGNMNAYIKVQLVGLSHGNGKNNRLGIGSRLELRAGNHYQMKTVTKPVMHFGLGKYEKADIVRIVWTNGVPQSIIAPKSDQDLVEEQMLKGSCPFLYTWNGEKYVFVKDMMWRSAIGMPLGIMGDKRSYAFPDISKEYLKIPGELLTPRDGKYSIRITEELWEAVYFDKLELIAVDHPQTAEVYVDEKFVLPPFPDRTIYKMKDKNTPVSAVDESGNDLLPQIAHHDDEYVANLKRSTYQGVTEMHELILDLGDKANAEKLYLFMRGWIFPTDASVNVAMAQTDQYRAVAPSLQVINEYGEWETVIDNLGFPMGKDKMVVTDLSGIFKHEDDRRVKIKTNMEIYWDHIFFSSCAPDIPVKLTNLTISDADLRFRGYSAMYRKGGQYGPHWFDYYDVEKGQKWRDLTGNYTRYGDVEPLLTEGDDKYIIANAGDEVAIEFSTAGLPELPEDWSRDFLIYSEGWVKDGDLNTAYGQTVEPLPFRKMSSYPYGEGEAYPNTQEYKDYRKRYNTREVNTDEFKNTLLPK